MGILEIKKVIIGMVQTNCYLLMNKQSKELIIVDPADSAMTIQQAISKLEGKPVGILLTHGHFDHIMAADEIKEHYGISIYAPESERNLLTDARLNASDGWAEPCTVEADIWLRDKQHITLAGFDVRALHTPGHTQGSMCYYLPQENTLLSGDTLFCGSVGRTDLPTGSMSTLKRSITALLASLPDEVAVYPGHGEATGIAYEKKYNPFA